MTFPVFKAGDAFLCGTGGGFDFHTPPPHLIPIQEVSIPFYDLYAGNSWRLKPPITLNYAPSWTVERGERC